MAERSGSPGIVATFVEEFHILGIVGNKGQLVIWHLDYAFVGITDTGLGFHSVLGGYEYDSVRCPRPVNGRGGSILKHGNGLDIIRVHVFHTPFHPVHEHER